MTFMCWFLAGVLVTRLYERLTRGMMVVIRGYHLHHSLYGVVLVLLAVLLREWVNPAIPAGLAAGVIVQHTFSERRFVFIDRVRA